MLRPFEYFLVLMKNALLMVGNSSAGGGAPAYAVPTVNIDSRQNRRFRCDSILDVEENREAISACSDGPSLRALTDLPKGLKPTHHFGRGNCPSAFLQVLQRPEIWNLPKQKLFNDVSEMQTSFAK